MTLDDIKRIDPKGMYNWIADFPQQIEEAVRIGKEVKIKLSKDSDQTRKVFEILSDFQDERLKGTDEKSGKGLLRVLKFYPGKNEFAISTVSALTGKSKEAEIHLYLGNN